MGRVVLYKKLPYIMAFIRFLGLAQGQRGRMAGWEEQRVVREGNKYLLGDWNIAVVSCS